MTNKKTITEAPNYIIYDNGDIYSKKSKKYLKSKKDKDGYDVIKLYVDSKPKDFKVHRLVGKAFIPNPDNNPVVHHKDGVRDNNNVENLEWYTHSENAKERYVICDCCGHRQRI